MIALSPNTAAAIALHAAEGSWVVFLQAIYPLERQGPIRIEGIKGSRLADRLISISRDSPCEVRLIGLLPTAIDPALHANEIAIELECVHDQWYSPTNELTDFIANSAQQSIIELLGQTHPGALDGQLVDIKQMAELLDVSVPTVRRMIKANEIPYLRFGWEYRFVPNEVIASLRER
jgi:excisionase family DNA binding protein